MKTYFDILKNVCILAHEEVPSSFVNQDSVYLEMKEGIKSVVDEVCSRFPWTFREKVYTLNTAVGQREYTFPEGLSASNVLENGVMAVDGSIPLYFVPHNDLDQLQSCAGRPVRYSFYAGKFILGPIPDMVYTLKVKYLTGNFAKTPLGEEKANLELADDVTIIPDNLVKIVEWGAYSLYRQNFKPDEKFAHAREKFLQLLIDSQKNDNYGQDATASILISRDANWRDSLLNGFFRA